MSLSEDTRSALAGRVGVASPVRATRRAGEGTGSRGEPDAEDPPTNGDLGRAIRALRRARRLTIEELAFAADIHPTYLSGIERGKRNPTWEKLCFLAGALGVAVADVVRRAESAARVQKGLERVLAQEQARSEGLPVGSVQDVAA